MKKIEKYHFTYDYLAINHGATILDQENRILLNKSIPNHIIPKIKKYLDLEKSISYFCCATLESRVDFMHENLTKIAVTYKTKEEAYAAYMNAYHMSLQQSSLPADGKDLKDQVLTIKKIRQEGSRYNFLFEEYTIFLFLL